MTCAEHGRILHLLTLSLPGVISTEILLTILIHCQADR